MAQHDFSVEKVPGTQSDDYRYRGPEGAFDFELGIDMYGLRPVIRDGHEVRIIDELQIAWADRAYPRPVARAVREPVIERLVAHFMSMGIECNVRLASGATRDASGQVRPGYRWQGAVTRHSDGWGIIDFYRQAARRSTAAYPSLATPIPWLGPSPYPDSIEYRDGDRRARIARRIERRLAAELPPRPYPPAGEHLLVRVLFPDTLCWIGGETALSVDDAEKECFGSRILALAEWTGRLYQLRHGAPAPDPNSAPVSDQDYEDYPFPSAND